MTKAQRLALAKELRALAACLRDPDANPREIAAELEGEAMKLEAPNKPNRSTERN